MKRNNPNNPNLKSASISSPIPTGPPQLATIQPQQVREEVAKRAYSLYLAQGCLEGRDVQNWLAAEAELLNERGRGSKGGLIQT